MAQLGEASGLEPPGRLGGQPEAGGDVTDHPRLSTGQAEAESQDVLFNRVEHAEQSIDVMLQTGAGHLVAWVDR
jgi:hypothetical protein